MAARHHSGVQTGPSSSPGGCTSASMGGSAGPKSGVRLAPKGPRRGLSNVAASEGAADIASRRKRRATAPPESPLSAAEPLAAPLTARIASAGRPARSSWRMVHTVEGSNEDTVCPASLAATPVALSGAPEEAPVGLREPSGESRGADSSLSALPSAASLSSSCCSSWSRGAFFTEPRGPASSGPNGAVPLDAVTDLATGGSEGPSEHPRVPPPRPGLPLPSPLTGVATDVPPVEAPMRQLR
mmetsp:Transcript_24566/g.92827  ORF Transcript_24566/g.92827 Transcript_24566/m.92827 type:complete len:242 (+) Transcript_24566:4814-5539(+)